MLKPRRIEVECPTDPRSCQIDHHTVTAAGGGELPGEVDVLADLEAVSEQGGAGVVAQLAPEQSSLPPMRAPVRRTAPGRCCRWR